MVRTVISTAVKAENSKYEEAVKTLNTLQTNAQTLNKIRHERDKYAHLNIPNMLRYAERVGIMEPDMDRLNVIHVSGTKGKGSTCAFCESVLRHHGYKTGFYSSPHLVEVRERFNVNGSPLERDKFASYFWDVYNKLDRSKADNDGMMPNYFGFLTVMALHVFLQEKVDVAIMEVGIGGQYDCTNLIRKPVACGVSSLGLDHTSVLGTSIEKIAWHKAGIFKPGVPAFTAPQVPEAMEVLQQRSIELQAPLSVCPDLKMYSEIVPKLGIKGKIQDMNASLALQLCHTWMKRQAQQGESTDTARPIANGHDEQTAQCSQSEPLQTTQCSQSEPLQTTQCSQSEPLRTAQPFNVTEQYLQGLGKCQWLGRNQTIKTSDLTFYLDGAHTQESMQQCTEWFQSETSAVSHRNGVYRVLIFNTTGDRNISPLIQLLQNCRFDAVLFCPNIAFEAAVSADQTNVASTKEGQVEKCLSNKRSWDQLLQDKQHRAENPQNVPVTNGNSNGDVSDHVTHIDQSTASQATSKSDTKHMEPRIFPSISQCINWIRHDRLKPTQGEPTEQCMNGGGKSTGGDTVCDEARTNGTDCTADTSRGIPSIMENGVNGHGAGEGMDSSPGKGVGDKEEVHVLITGSLHLVGGALRVIWEEL